MNKKTIITISIVSAILSLVYVLLNYFGFIRYSSIYFSSTEKYEKNYKNLDKIGNYKTVISLTVTPNQMSKLSNVIKSLLDQTIRVDLISIILPDENKYQIPKDLVNSISLFTCEQDQGILNCLIPAILKENESTTRIITLGGGTIYGKDFIETLMEESEKHPDKIIYVNNNNNTIDLTKGVVFSTNFFNVDFLDLDIQKVSDNEGNKFVNDYFKNFPKQKINYTENYKTL